MLPAAWWGGISCSAPMSAIQAGFQISVGLNAGVAKTLHPGKRDVHRIAEVAPFALQLGIADFGPPTFADQTSPRIAAFAQCQNQRNDFRRIVTCCP